MWTADSVQITADQTCWTADGYNGCLGGGGSGYPVQPYVVVYERLPVETVKEVASRVEKFKEEEGKPVSQEAIDAITGAMVDTWSQEDMKDKMELYGISQEIAILSYRRTIESLIRDDELALILILASI